MIDYNGPDYLKGHDDGHANGFSKGHDEGFASGYAKAKADLLELVEANKALQATGNVVPFTSAAGKPPTRNYNVILRRKAVQYAHIRIEAASAQEAVSLAMFEPEQDMPWEPAAAVEASDWIRAEGRDENNQPDQFEWTEGQQVAPRS